MSQEGNKEIPGQMVIPGLVSMMSLRAKLKDPVILKDAINEWLQDKKGNLMSEQPLAEPNPERNQWPDEPEEGDENTVTEEDNK
jgi:hypothetical protein